MLVEFFFDGGGSHNGSPAGWGWVAMLRGHEYACGSHGMRPGTTNNVAEYEALIRAAEYASAHDWSSKLGPGAGEAVHFHFRGDSLLVVNQVTGVFRVKNAVLAEQHERVMSALEPLDYRITWVPRAENQRADMLATQGRSNYRRGRQ